MIDVLLDVQEDILNNDADALNTSVQETRCLKSPLTTATCQGPCDVLSAGVFLQEGFCLEGEAHGILHPFQCILSDHIIQKSSLFVP